MAFYSRKLLPREEKYATVEKECLTITKVTVEVFKVYQLGRHFTDQTYHRALEWLACVRDKNARLTRWSLTLQPYDFDVIYRKGQRTGMQTDSLVPMTQSRHKPTPTIMSQEKGRGTSNPLNRHR